jgi:hypothetical protein
VGGIFRPEGVRLSPQCQGNSEGIDADDPYRFNPRPWRIDTEQARGLTGLKASDGP